MFLLSSRFCCCCVLCHCSYARLELKIAITSQTIQPNPSHTTTFKMSNNNIRINPWNKQPFTPKFYVLEELTARLPVSKVKERVMKTIRDNQITIIIVVTGSGKTTQITKWLLEMGMVVCTQPRRLAASHVSYYKLYYVILAYIY